MRVDENTTYKNIYRTEIKAEPAEIKPNEAVKLTFTVKNEKGEALKDFEIVNEKPVKTENSANSNKKMANAENNTVSVRVTFPNSELYKIFVEVKRAGKVVMIPFTVDVKRGKSEKILTDAKIPQDYYKIVVSREDFTPNEVALSKDSPVKLAFVRVDEENCADEVVLRI